MRPRLSEGLVGKLRSDHDPGLSKDGQLLGVAERICVAQPFSSGAPSGGSGAGELSFSKASSAS